MASKILASRLISFGATALGFPTKGGIQGLRPRPCMKPKEPPPRDPLGEVQPIREFASPPFRFLLMKELV